MLGQLGGGRPVGRFCIRGARVSPAGSVLDPVGIVLAADSQPLYEPDVAFDGTNHLVAYENHASGDSDIHAVRMAPSGTVQTPFPVSSAPMFQQDPAVASDGSGGSLIVWEDWRTDDNPITPGAITASRVVNTGGALDPDGIVVSAELTGRRLRRSPGTAGYLVVWADAGTARATCVLGPRSTARGWPATDTVEDPSGFPIRTSYIAEKPSVAAQRATFLVVWSGVMRRASGSTGRG